MMKKNLALIFAIVMVFSLTACGSDEIPMSSDIGMKKEDNNQIDNENTQETSDNIDIGDIDFDSDGAMVIKDIDGSQAVQKPDGSWVIRDGDGGEGQFGGNWPDNEFTKMIPKPDFTLVAANTTSEEFTVSFIDATLEQIVEYTEKVKEKGFTIDADLQNQETMGMIVYCYLASNDEGYSIKIMSTSGTSVITISKK